MGDEVIGIDGRNDKLMIKDRFFKVLYRIIFNLPDVLTVAGKVSGPFFQTGKYVNSLIPMKNVLRSLTFCVCYLCLFFCLIPLRGFAQETRTRDQPVIQTSRGWTLKTVPSQGLMTISFDSLGTLLDGVRLSVRTGAEPVTFTAWTAKAEGESGLTVQTVNPASTWKFTIIGNLLEISCTSDDAFITGVALSTDDRIVARLLDPGGIPVKGQEESCQDGGKETGTLLIPQNILM